MATEPTGLHGARWGVLSIVDETFSIFGPRSLGDVHHYDCENAGRALLESIVDIAATEGPASFVRENCGGLCVRLAEKLVSTATVAVIKNMTLPLDALAGRGLSRITFTNCYFRSTMVSGVLKDIRFQDCEFEHLEVDDEFSFGRSSFDNCSIHGLTVTRGERAADYYDPPTIEAYLSHSGATITKRGQEILIAGTLPEDDERIKTVRKLIQIFRRSTQVSDSVITLRLGVHGSIFFSEMCSKLLDAGVLRPVKNRGGGNQRRFRLGRSMAVLSQALAKANGSFSEFIEASALGPEPYADDIEDE